MEFIQKQLIKNVMPLIQKISYKNAFEVNLPQQDFENEDWNRFSNIMDCSSKIYG